MTRPRRTTKFTRRTSRNLGDYMTGQEQEADAIFKDMENAEIQPRRRSLRVQNSKKVHFEESVSESLRIEEASTLEENQENPIIETCNTTTEQPMEEEFWAITPPRDSPPEEEGAHISDGTETLPPTAPTIDYSQFSPLETPFQLSALPETVAMRNTRSSAPPQESLPPTVPKADYDLYSILEMPGIPADPAEKRKTQEVTESFPATASRLDYAQFSLLETPYALSALPPFLPKRGTAGRNGNACSDGRILSQISQTANQEDQSSTNILDQNLPLETPAVDNFMETKHSKKPEDKEGHPVTKEEVAYQQGEPELAHFIVSGKQNYDDSSMWSCVSATLHCDTRQRTPLQQRFPW